MSVLAVAPGLGPDQAVPQRDRLLDSAAVAERFELLLGLDGPLAIDSCRRIRVKYRVGARLRVVYRVEGGFGSVNVAASTFATPGRSERAYVEARARAVPCGRVRPVAHDRELATVFWTFPNDRKIDSLPALVAPSPDLVVLRRSWVRSELAAHAPEKAATVRCLNASGRTIAFAKAYAGDEGARTRRVHDALTGVLGAEDPHLRLPQALGYSARHRTLLVERVEGAPVHAPRRPDQALRYRKLGRALARLHGLPAPGDVRFRRADPDRLAAAAGLIGSVRGDVAAEAAALADEVSARLDAGGEGTACLHGDVNFRNALLEDGHVALIDLDQVAAGPPAAELGSVLAALRYGGVVGLLRSDAVPELGAALLAGYAEVGRVPPADALRAYTAAALLGERAIRVVTRVRPEGLRRLPELLAEARGVLA